MADRTKSTAHQERDAKETFMTLVATADAYKSRYIDLLPGEISWEVFKDTFKLALQQNPRLMDADRPSLWMALEKAALDGLKPDGREGAFVIFGDDSEDEDGNRIASTAGKPKRVVWMPMIGGLIKLVRNTGNVAGIRAKLIYRGEVMEICDEDGKESYRHVRALDADSQIDDSPDNIVGAYAVVNYKDGSWELEVMSRRQIDRVKAVSRAKKGPWLPWYDEMAKKTVLRRLIKRLDKSPVNRIEAALDRDETMTIDGVAEGAEAGRNMVVTPPPPRRAAPPEPERRHEQTQRPSEHEGTHQEPKGTSTAARATQGGTQDPGAGADTQKEPDPAQGDPVVAGEVLEYWPVDDIGEPVPDGDDTLILRGALAFANWFAAEMAKTERPEALKENNLDALAEAHSDPAAAAVIDAALAAKPKEDAPAEPAAEETSEPTGAKVPIPVSPANKPLWKPYQDACQEALGLLTTGKQIAAWVEANAPVYGGKAVGAAIERLVRERRVALGLKPEGAPAAAKQDGAPDFDQRWADDQIPLLDAMKLPRELDAWGNADIAKTKMARFKRERLDLFDLVRLHADKTYTRLTPPKPE